MKSPERKDCVSQHRHRRIHRHSSQDFGDHQTAHEDGLVRGNTVIQDRWNIDPQVSPKVSQAGKDESSRYERDGKRDQEGAEKETNISGKQEIHRKQNEEKWFLYPNRAEHEEGCQADSQVRHFLSIPGNDKEIQECKKNPERLGIVPVVAATLECVEREFGADQKSGCDEQPAPEPIPSARLSRGKNHHQYRDREHHDDLESPLESPISRDE
ncbi:hypothetical protein HY285_04695 [Candidatus Peregrinibacteria bacterium]|nr:hypothetical protein [Candidatus Peregrinibacteria bacterium]MBI3816810.1 hypothetical protein [Candidatus Peregrinibacteria bacterium]